MVIRLTEPFETQTFDILTFRRLDCKWSEPVQSTFKWKSADIVANPVIRGIRSQG